MRDKWKKNTVVIENKGIKYRIMNEIYQKIIYKIIGACTIKTKNTNTRSTDNKYLVIMWIHIYELKKSKNIIEEEQ